MADKSKIAWCDATWNVTAGCSKVSAGCEHCYAEKQARRISTMNPRPARYFHVLTTSDRPADDGKWNGKISLFPERLDQPLRWRKPRRIFVNSMSDLFHPGVPFEFILKVFAIMALCPQHCFQVLSKRPERMVEYFSGSPLDRVSALVQDATYEQGRRIAINRGCWRTGDRRDGESVATEEASRPGGCGRRRLRDGNQNEPMLPCAGGISDTTGLPACDNDDRWGEDSDGSAPGGVGEQKRANPAGPHNQPQEREETRQPACQPRTRDVQPAASPCSRRSACSAASPTGVETSEDASNGSGCFEDAATPQRRDDGEGHRGIIRDDKQGNISDLLPPNLETHLTWPLTNVWLGTSIEDQATADERIPWLLKCPAAVRFVSLEPLLGPITLPRIDDDGEDIPRDERSEWGLPATTISTITAPPESRIDWCIVGSESGPRRRPCKLEDVESIVEQCKAASVACYVKQVEINGKVSHDPSEWPESIRVREMPKVCGA